MLQSSAIRRAQQLIRDDDRYTDLGIVVRVVSQDLKTGIEVKANKPPVTLVSEHRFGGLFDNLKREIVGPTKDPLVWYVSEQQWPLINHEPVESRILAFGAEGAGKSHSMACYLALSVIRNIGVKGNAGCTAPTGDRLRTLTQVLRSVIPIDTPHQRRRGSWGTFHGYGGPGEIRFCTGLTLQMRPTHQVSVALGSPIQGSSWIFCVSDEIQDTIEERGDRDGDIEARLRSAPGGKSKRFCTATSKDSSKFRDWKSKKLQSPDWTIERMPYQSNWSIWPEHWENMRRNLSAREFKRRCLAQDLPPETAVYSAWDREKNTLSIPDVGVRDVTSSVLSQFGANIEMLLGHDPGTTQDCTIFLKAYQFRKEPFFRWVVVDEVTTKGTSERHASILVETLQSRWGVNYPGAQESKALMRCDPYGDSGNSTDRSVYLTFRLAQLDCRSAQYDKRGRGKGVIHKEARIEMVNRLLCSAVGDRRLYIAMRDGAPCAKNLVRCFEHSERDLAGKAENQRKGSSDDLSHWGAALGYALWPTEKIHRVIAAQTKVDNQWC